LPIFDYQCSLCGEFEIDVIQSRDAPLPMCRNNCVKVELPNPAAVSTMEKLWSAGSSSSPFKEVSVEISGRTVTCKSMSDVRRLENASIDAWQKGVPGAQPIIFRNFSQDRSNSDVSPIEKHFSDRVRHQRSGDPRDRPENFSKVSGRRKIDIRAVTNREEHARLVREHGFDRED
jgi:hypothetical protein